MRRLITAFALLAASAAFAPAPMPKKEPPPKAPLVRFLGVSQSEDGSPLLRFEVINPTAAPLHYLGYLPSINAEPTEAIGPLYAIDLSDGKEWKVFRRFIGCGTGLGKVALPAGARGTFVAVVPEGDWQQIRIGLRLYESDDRDGRGTLWSDPVSRAAAMPRR